MARKPLRMPHARRSKYAAVRTEVDGITFHSKREAARYGELKLLEKARRIDSVRLQPELELCAVRHPLGPIRIGTYRADFKYWDKTRGCEVWEDVKGMDTPLSKWKRKHVLAQYGIHVQIVK
jgi:hypothetical protein